MVFPDITSRRLGRRGHTSHHYNHFRRKGDTSAQVSTSIGSRMYEDRAVPPAPQYRDIERTNNAPYPINQSNYDPYANPPPQDSSAAFFAAQTPSHREFNASPPQERIARYTHGAGPPPQPAPFLMRNGEDSDRVMNSHLHNGSSSRGHVKMELTSSLPMGQSSFGDEDYFMLHKRYASHPSPYPYSPPQPMRSPLQPPPSPLLPPSHLSHHTVPPQPPLSNHPPPPVPTYSQPSVSPSHPSEFPAAAVEKSSLRALIESPGIYAGSNPQLF